jgi:mono/diheme cytochrome c family protein
LRTARLGRGARAAAAAVLAAAVLPGCTDWAMYDVDVALGEIPQVSTMRRDVVPDPYEMLRTPAEGSVPLMHPNGDAPLHYTQAALDSIAPLLTNPLQPTPEVLARGREMYDRNCTICHGPGGLGDGPVVAQGGGPFPFATNLVTGLPVARSDGYLYAVIDVGRGLMPGYGPRITHADRWAIVMYMRQLQGQVTATPDAGPQTSIPAATLEGAEAPPAERDPIATPPAEVPTGLPGSR